MAALDLLIIPSVAMEDLGGGRIRADIKFAEGMKFYARRFPGQVSCIVERGNPGVFAIEQALADLPFGVKFIDDFTSLRMEDLAGQVVLAGGDNYKLLHLAQQRRPGTTRLVYTIEYILETRLQILDLEKRTGLRKLRGLAWQFMQENRRRRAFRRADGLQMNGYPARDAYAGMTPSSVFYLDNRMTSDLFATVDEMRARRAHLLGGGPLRLVNSGRLEPMKGAQDLIPIAQSLARDGVNFTLDIFGTGSLQEPISAEIREKGLGDRVRLHDPVDFETELVPFARSHADIFLSCHRQSDPSCSYLENMGCGLAVAGYDNRMWSALQQEAKAGWIAPLGRPEQLAQRIRDADKDRGAIFRNCEISFDFAKKHDFETEFTRRIAQLESLAA